MGQLCDLSHSPLAVVDNRVVWTRSTARAWIASRSEKRGRKLKPKPLMRKLKLRVLRGSVSINTARHPAAARLRR